MRWPVLIASAALALAQIGALARGDEVDGNGCHTNKKTSDYNCHGGGSPSPRPSQSVYIAPPAAPRVTQPNHLTATAAGPATLVSVCDRDTIRVTSSKGQKAMIRMACIDAPETAQGESGTQATLVMKQLLGS
jgi:hypothetical protein